MYRLKPGIKDHLERRWRLPDRIFFGNGACHILAGVFLNRPPMPGFYAEWIIPGEGFSGSHIYVTNGCVAFDYHGYSSRLKLLLHHTTAWSRQYPRGWNCAIERVWFDLLETGALNCRNMRGPDQYAGDPILRAQNFLERICHKEAAARAVDR